MPTAKPKTTPQKLVPTAAESNTVARPKRVRLAKAIAAATPKLERAKQIKAGGKLLSNRYTIPANEYAQLIELKKRLLSLGVGAKKSELLRAGLMALACLNDAQLKKAVAKVELASTIAAKATDIA
jgi:hypothetical protein